MAAAAPERRAQRARRTRSRTRQPAGSEPATSRANGPRRGAHDSRPAVRVDRPGRARPADRVQARRVPETPARGLRSDRAGRCRRPQSTALCWSGSLGPLLGLVLILKLLQHRLLRRPSTAVRPLSGSELRRIRQPDAARASVGQATGTPDPRRRWALLVIGVPVLMALAVRRVTRIAAEHRVWTLRAVAGLGAGMGPVPGVRRRVRARRRRSPPRARPACSSARRTPCGRTSKTTVHLRPPDQPAISSRPLPPVKLLTGLRGKDVLLLFVESYGKVAVQGTSDRASGRLGSGQGRQAAGRPPGSLPAAPS